MTRRIICICLAFLFLFLASCEDKGDYTYEEIYEGTHPGHLERMYAQSFFDIQQAYSAAGQGGAQYQETRKAIKQKYQRTNLPVNRDIFLTIYFDIAEDPIIVPKNKNIFPDKIEISDSNNYWQGEDHKCNIRITYRNTPQGDEGYWQFSTKPSDEWTARYEKGEYAAVGEMYYGKGFHAQLVNRGTEEDPSYNIFWWDAQDNLMGHITGTYEQLEIIMEQLDDFEAVTFHKAVQSAKEPK